MDPDIVIGLFILILSYGFTVYLVLHCRRLIDRIAKRELGSLREITKKLNHK